MAGQGYTTCAIPDGLARRIEAVLADPYFGYRNRGEFVVDAVRRLLEDCESRPSPGSRDPAPARDDIVRRRS